MSAERQGVFEVSAADADLYPINEQISVEAAWRAGLDPTAGWIATEVKHTMAGTKYTVMVSVRRLVG